MDDFLGNAKWKEVDDFAYYDSGTVRRVLGQMRKCRRLAEKGGDKAAVEDLKVLIEACVKNNWVGVENPRLYSQTYYGTKNLVQNFIDEGEFVFVLLFGLMVNGWLTWRFMMSSGTEHPGLDGHQASL